VTALVRQPERFSSAGAELRPDEYSPRIPKEDWGLVEYLNARDRSMIRQDRPEHRAIRQAIHRWFTPRAVENWRAQLRGQARVVIERRMADGELDVKNDFAISLPLQTIGLMLHVPGSDTGRLHTLSVQRLGLLGVEPDRARTATRAHFELEDYFEPLITARRDNGSEDDLISLLAAAEARGEFDRVQCLATLVLLLIAGHETTQNLICNGILSFARNPDQWEAFRRDPAGHAATAVEECLRFEPSVKMLTRICAEDLEFGGKEMAAGDNVVEHPDVFDIFRSPNPHVAFGGGIHHCLGASLARVEAQEAFCALAEFVPELELKEDTVEYVPTTIHRAVRDLHLVLR
jgi:cytochrome P450